MQCIDKQEKVYKKARKKYFKKKKKIRQSIFLNADFKDKPSSSMYRFSLGGNCLLQGIQNLNRLVMYLTEVSITCIAS